MFKISMFLIAALSGIVMAEDKEKAAHEATERVRDFAEKHGGSEIREIVHALRERDKDLERVEKPNSKKECDKALTRN
jgi:hypothetical protein